MEYRKLGKSGLKVSVVGLGCNNFGGRSNAEQTNAVVNRSLDEGITLFDTADYYGNRGGSEELLGKALGNHRHEIVLATKFFMAMGEGPYMYGGSRRYVIAACEASLKRLGTDYIDLYQMHFPDPETPIEETMEAMNDLVRSGKVRYIGCSNFTAWELVESLWVSSDRGFSSFISAQNEYSLLERSIETELIPACQHFGIGILPYFPLALGFLTGKYRRGVEPPKGTRLAVLHHEMVSKVLTQSNFDVLEKLEQFVRQRGHTLIELAFAWLASRPQIASVIAGATKPEQISENVKTVEWQLSPEEVKEVDAITQR